MVAMDVALSTIVLSPPLPFHISSHNRSRAAKVSENFVPRIIHFGDESQFWQGFNGSALSSSNGKASAPICQRSAVRASQICRDFDSRVYESFSHAVEGRTSNQDLHFGATTSGFRHGFDVGASGGGMGRRRGPLKLCASQHVGGGSVERNDAAATGPLVKPDAKFTAEEAVKVQMDALAQNDDPRLDHGLEVMYYFANAEGTLDGGSLSRYFGFATDLYHFGHFALKFKTRYPELICHDGYEIISVKESGEECEVNLKLIQRSEGTDSCWAFSLTKCARGRLSPCWLTSRLLRHDPHSP